MKSCHLYTFQLFIIFSNEMILFRSKKSKAQAKKQKVAKKPRGEEGADPYDFESEEEEQDTGGKL